MMLLLQYTILINDIEYYAILGELPLSYRLRNTSLHHRAVY